jgi:hypothetical protein
MGSLVKFKGAQPFDHCVIDNFFTPGVAEQLEGEFIKYDDPKWFYYKNAIEDKKALNDWNQFPQTTYAVFSELMSKDFVEIVRNCLGVNIYVDHGLHGGGWHIHGNGGNLNPHLDYSIHPKLGLLRKVNIIVYLSKELRDQHGGHLGLWGHSPSENNPGSLVAEVEPKFNRAVMFDTTQNSWHGISRKLIVPDGVFRKSLAIYYLTEPPFGTDPREKALFAPRDEQKGDKDIENLIKLRADKSEFFKAYKS